MNVAVDFSVRLLSPQFKKLNGVEAPAEMVKRTSIVKWQNGKMVKRASIVKWQNGNMVKRTGIV